VDRSCNGPSLTFDFELQPETGFKTIGQLPKAVRLEPMMVEPSPHLAHSSGDIIVAQADLDCVQACSAPIRSEVVFALFRK
jgi:hypothetical protein